MNQTDLEAMLAAWRLYRDTGSLAARDIAFEYADKTRKDRKK